MKKKSNSIEKFTFFISWSNPQSKEFAYAIRRLLCKVFKIEEIEMFISDSDLTGKGNMVDNIRTIASYAQAEIICLTKGNLTKPWIHYELGVSSCLAHKNEKMIWPVCFNLTPKDIPSTLSMINQYEIVSASEHEGTKVGDDCFYNELMRRLIFHVDKFLSKDMPNKYRCHRYANPQDNDINLYSKQIEETVEDLKHIFNKYDKHDYYMSRPMQGIDIKTNKLLYGTLCDIKKYFKGKRDFYFSGLDQENVSIPLSRIDIIKSCRTFIMIYPQIPELDKGLAPSSCFVELGAALAMHINIQVFAQYGAKLPEFLNDKYGVFSVDYFSSIDEVYDLMVEYVEKRIKDETRG